MAGVSGRYERYKKGEALETLLEEARQAASARLVDPKTSRPAAVKKS
jgi:hypothetical protein